MCIYDFCRFFLWTDFDDFFPSLLLIMSSFQNIKYLLSTTTMTYVKDIFRFPVHPKIYFFSSFLFIAFLINFCPTFFFGLKLMPEIVVIQRTAPDPKDKGAFSTKNHLNILDINIYLKMCLEIFS